MLKRIKVNIEEVESMLYFWQATQDREKVSEEFLNEVSGMKGLSLSYDNEFNGESVRRVLSAVTNREKLSQKTQKEARFWNNNMWMLEDLENTLSMIRPLKHLNLDGVTQKIKDNPKSEKYEEIEVIFSPMHMDEYIISSNMLIINFFRVMPSFENEDEALIGGKELKVYIEEKIIELLNI